QVVSDSIGKSVDRARGFLSPGVLMNPHVTKILAEPWFEKRTRFGTERFARRVQNFMHYCRRKCRAACAVTAALQRCPFFLLAFFALSPTHRVLSAVAGTLQNRPVRRRKQGDRCGNNWCDGACAHERAPMPR